MARKPSTLQRLLRWLGLSPEPRAKPGPPPPPTEERYLELVRVTAETIAIYEDALPANFREENFYLAAVNLGFMASLHGELGLLDWRRGFDPRPHFENLIATRDRQLALAMRHALPHSGTNVLTYAVLSLMGYKVAVESGFDRSYQKRVRWTCYDSALASALHHQQLPEWQSALLASHLAANRGLIDKSWSIYFQLLGMIEPERPAADLVAVADANWPKRRRNRMFEAAEPCDGGGEFNDYYPDFRLAAVLAKIGWQGESPHRWRW